MKSSLRCPVTSRAPRRLKFCSAAWEINSGRVAAEGDNKMWSEDRFWPLSDLSRAKQRRLLIGGRADDLRRLR